MKIRTKLLLIIICLSLPIVLNLFVLGVLLQTVTQSVQAIQEVSVRQQAVTLRMQAQLRDAEAALYSYQIEGESGFAQQFQILLSNFSEEVDNFETLSTSAEEHLWVDQLNIARQEAATVGNDLISLKDKQTTDLAQMGQLHDGLVNQLDNLRLAKSVDERSYQTVLSTMLAESGEMQRAAVAYLASGKSTDLVRFSTAKFTFRISYLRLVRQNLTPQERQGVEVLWQDFDQIQNLGTTLISGRDQQRELFAAFSAQMFQIGQEIIVGQILPYEANNLREAQENLNSTLSFAFLWSLFVSIVAVIIALSIAIPLLRRITGNFQALLSGADRVSAGNLTQPIQVSSADELAYLGQTFNTMMEDLAVRESLLQRRILELETLREVSLQLTSVLDISHLFQTIAASSRRLVDAAEAHIFLHNEQSGQTLRQASAWRNPDRRPKPQQARQGGLVMKAIQAKTTQILNNASELPRYTAPDSPVYGLRAVAAFPLKLADRVLGVFNVALDDRDSFREGELRILQLIADQAAVPLENARLYQNLAENETRLNDLLHKLAIVQEEERRLVGLDLHDGLTQILLSANMHLNTLSFLQNELGAASKTELTTGQQRLKEAIKEVNWVISELRPTELEDFGLVDGLQHYITKVAGQQGWRFKFLVNLKRANFKSTVETAVFRIIQEALSNARKYAKTDQILVELRIDGPCLVVRVQDWGRGFAVERFDGETLNSLGLLGMRERAELLRGQFMIESVIGQGTIIQAIIPFEHIKAKDAGLSSLGSGLMGFPGFSNKPEDKTNGQ